MSVAGVLVSFNAPRILWQVTRGKETGRERERHTYRHTYRQTDRFTYRDDERETDRQDRQIELEREEKFPLNRMVMVRLRRS